EGELCNALVVKVKQVGSLSRTLEAVEEARQGGWAWSVSHRSGETCDDFIADLAVGAGAPFIKTGAPARGERTSKYNRLLAVEEEGVKFNPLGLGG
ncbi:phosphopyruvate hydratase, partial [bacterium]|nr:phosphopyruvate hydratase [bacterium]